MVSFEIPLINSRKQIGQQFSLLEGVGLEGGGLEGVGFEGGGDREEGGDGEREGEDKLFSFTLKWLKCLSREGGSVLKAKAVFDLKSEEFLREFLLRVTEGGDWSRNKDASEVCFADEASEELSLFPKVEGERNSDWDFVRVGLGAEGWGEKGSIWKRRKNS